MTHLLVSVDRLGSGALAASDGKWHIPYRLAIGERQDRNYLLTHPTRGPILSAMKDMSDAIGLWPNLETFAFDAGVPPGTVMVWRTRHTIPYARWDRLAKAAKKRGISGFTVEGLARIAATRAGI